jgi:hypothetical protein
MAFILCNVDARPTARSMGQGTKAAGGVGLADGWDTGATEVAGV